MNQKSPTMLQPRLGVFCFALFSAYLLLWPQQGQAITVTESSDLPGGTAGPTYILDFGVNSISGMVSTPGDKQDSFSVTVPQGFQINQVAKNVTAVEGPSFSGNVTFNQLSLSGTGQGAFPLPMPLQAGTYGSLVSADFSVGNPWTVTITVGLAPDYLVTTTSGLILITDTRPGGGTLNLSNPGGNNLILAAAGRTFSVNGAANRTNDSGNLSLSGIDYIQVSESSGNDAINVGSFSNFPSLSIYGGAGTNAVNLNGDITFAPDQALEVDLDNFDASPGYGNITLASNAKIVTSGSGYISLVASRNVSLSGGSLLQSANGDITIAANQQSTPASGTFDGVDLFTSTVKSTGSGNISITGTGGNGTGDARLGVLLLFGAKIIGGTAGTVQVEGIGGAGGGVINRGVTIYGSDSQVTSQGANISVNGQGGPGGAAYGIGVSLLFGGQIIAGGSGSVSIEGLGRGLEDSGSNRGIELSGTNSLVSSLGGDISLYGKAGPGVSPGIFIGDAASIASPAAGGNIELYADSFELDSTIGVTNFSPSSTITVGPYLSTTKISFGGSDSTGTPNTLGLTTSRLAHFATSNLKIQGSSFGGVSFDAGIAVMQATNFTISASQPIVPSAAGTDVTLETNATLSLEGKLAIAINGPVADTDYPQLKVDGNVNLGSAMLQLSFPFVGMEGNVFTLVNNAGTNPILGSFSAYPEGAFLTWPGDTNLLARISYHGGDGNDATLSLVTILQALSVTTNSATGPGSLLSSLNLAATLPGSPAITFAGNLSGQAIVLNSEILIGETNSVMIDASSLPHGLFLDGGNGTNRLFFVPPNASLALIGLTITGGDGGGIVSSGSGGALLNFGKLALTNCTLLGNTCSSGGGAVRNTGQLSMTRCTVLNNSSAFGGALATSGGLANLVHCTFTLNHAIGFQSGFNGGGAIDSFSSASIKMNACLFSGNLIDTTNGPEVWIENGNISATNCLVRNGTDSTLVAGINGSLIGTTSGGPVDALLGTLGDYGGPTLTVPLRFGSPARDMAPLSTSALDQRGYPIVGVPDIGAYEAGTPTSYGTWIVESFPVGAASSNLLAGADYDGDGSPNVLEYALQTDPRSNKSAPGLNFSANGGVPSAMLTLMYRENAIDLTYLLERSPDLMEWTNIFELDTSTSSLVTGSSVDFINSPGKFIITDFADPGASKMFYRLRLFYTPPPEIE